MGVVPGIELCEHTRVTLADPHKISNMALVIKVTATLCLFLALTSGRPDRRNKLRGSKANPSVVDLSTLSLDARDSLDAVWESHFDRAESTNTIEEGSGSEEADENEDDEESLLRRFEDD